MASFHERLWRRSETSVAFTCLQSVARPSWPPRASRSSRCGRPAATSARRCAPRRCSAATAGWRTRSWRVAVVEVPDAAGRRAAGHAAAVPGGAAADRAPVPGPGGPAHSRHGQPAERPRRSWSSPPAARWPGRPTASGSSRSPSAPAASSASPSRSASAWAAPRWRPRRTPAPAWAAGRPWPARAAARRAARATSRSPPPRLPEPGARRTRGPRHPVQARREAVRHATPTWSWTPKPRASCSRSRRAPPGGCCTPWSRRAWPGRCRRAGRRSPGGPGRSTGWSWSSSRTGAA